MLTYMAQLFDLRLLLLLAISMVALPTAIAQAATSDEESVSQTAPAIELSGSWSGSWRSCSSGHQGPLSATFCRLDEKHYRVDFRGRFFKLFPFRYSVTLTVVEQSDRELVLAGSSYLGRLFGTFHYRATATADTFTATYSSCQDRGKFVMRKCGCCP